MPSSGEIRRKAAGVRAISEDIRRESSKYQSVVNDVSTWWKGEAGTSFRTGYQQIHREISDLLRKLNDLEFKVGSNLANAVDRAEERKAMEERQRLAASKR
ncbi:WXG100 family type VII secretion target [Paenibacillus ihumii]|uniref:WXG100 family type VII secretion target n=1 Tax=Paenibacillus ihumii TaxID=687436 RepID=UPI0006D8370E|nr:WXG100 family type VII secretion target [Paenibacillus ihumii]